MNASLCGIACGVAWIDHDQPLTENEQEQLQRLAEFDEVRGYMLPDAYTLAERAYFAINPDEQGDREAAAMFWRDDVDDDFVDAWIEGALSAGASE